MVRIGIIGTGRMANGQAELFQKIKGVKLVACCDVDPSRAAAFAAKFKIPASYGNCEEMLDTEKLDGISNVTPDAQHAQVALAVLKRKIPILSEKPLAANLAEAKVMAAAARKSGVVNMVNFTYRNSAALQQVSALVRAGGIGELRHVESSYLQCWLTSKIWGDWRSTDAMLWRLSTRHGSAGTLGDIGVHIYDMTSLICGDIAAINCILKTFPKGVKNNRIGHYVFDANDSFVSQVTFANGALGTIHASRWATGQPNSLRVRAYGTTGAIDIDLDRSLTEYRICQGADVDKAVWKTVTCKPTPNNYERFVKAIRTGRGDNNDFQNALKIQACLHYSLESDRLKRTAKVKI